MMETIDMAIQEIGVMDARRSLTALIEAAQVRGDRFILERYRQPAAVLLGYEDFQRLTALEGSLLERNRDTFREAGPILPEALLERYHDLSDRRLRGELSAEGTLELQQVEEQLEDLEAQHPLLRALDEADEQRHAEMMGTLTEIRQELRQLVDLARSGDGLSQSE
jgi:PHD/YefM family antitoxin component YafN of YafNO toxin-antitoxin module